MRHQCEQRRGAGLAVAAALSFGAAAAMASEPPPWAVWPVRGAAAEAPRSETVTPRVLWRLDCATDAEPLVGRIVSAAPGREGRTLLVDRQLCRVLVVSPEGRIERALGREGEGPGELSGAYRALQLADGRIGIANGTSAPGFMIGGRGEVVFLDSAAESAGEWLAAGEPGDTPTYVVRELRCAGGRTLVATYRMDPAGLPLVQHVRELALLAAPAGGRTVVARSIIGNSLKDRVVKEAEFFEPFAHGRCDLAAGGRVAFAPERDRWLVAIREPDGSGFLVERPWKAVQRSPAARQRALEALGDGAEDHVLAHEPALGRLRWRPDGGLWVEPFAVEPAAGAFACFDELDPQGNLRRRVQLVLPGNRERDELVLMEDGRFVLLRGFKRTAEADEDDLGAEGGAEVVLLQ